MESGKYVRSKQLEKLNNKEFRRDMVPETLSFCRHSYLEVYRAMSQCFYEKKLNGKRKPSRFSLIRLPFVHRTNGSLSFVRWLMKKQTELILLQTD
jgi:hypothetical protein